MSTGQSFNSVKKEDELITEEQQNDETKSMQTSLATEKLETGPDETLRKRSSMLLYGKDTLDLDEIKEILSTDISNRSKQQKEILISYFKKL